MIKNMKIIKMTILLLTFGFIACNSNLKKETKEKTNEVKTKFSSNIRPHKLILLNQIYTDTIVFLAYEDDYDYFMLQGKQNGKNVSLIYNWEHNETSKYNFKLGDLIKIKWKMKSISIAGDGETLDYIENAIDAEKIK